MNESKCIFCLTKRGQFTQIEHIVPESLGGDDILPPGIVCDECNNYFGHAIEGHVLATSVFGAERSYLSVKSKRGRFTTYKGIGFEICGGQHWSPIAYLDDRIFTSVLEHGHGHLILPDLHVSLIVRLLLKMGLEFLALDSTLDVYDPMFNAARIAARRPIKGSTWQLIRDVDLNNWTPRYLEDDEGPYAQRTLYEYKILGGPLDVSGLSNQFIFNFAYGSLEFAVPLIPWDISHVIDYEDYDSRGVRRPRIENISLTGCHPGAGDK